MKIVPISLKVANEYVAKHHRHNKPVRGHKFSIGAEINGELVGVAICGRPIARMLDNGKTLEVYRVCTDGTFNTTSFLYARCRRISQLLGYEKIITYTLKSESGSSLKAVNATPEAETKAQGWSRENRKREHQEVYTQEKIRWAI